MNPTPQFIQIYQGQAEHIREELLSGLRASKAHTSPKYLYDELGSKLFEAITCIPEYYPTRTEALIFASHGHERCQGTRWCTHVKRPGRLTYGGGINQAH